jgi:hypothetical protein
MQLVLSCPAFMKMSMEMSKDPKAMEKLQNKAKNLNKVDKEETADSDEVIGSLASFTPADISSIMVKEKNGKTSKLYWMEYFENADNFMTNMKKYLNKKVSVSYIVRDVYDAVKKTYKSIKVITSLDLE